MLGRYDVMPMMVMGRPGPLTTTVKRGLGVPMLGTVGTSPGRGHAEVRIMVPLAFSAGALGHSGNDNEHDRAAAARAVE